ncbi:MAG: hypothetical protein H0U74_05355 [Bradymonadaceae bacterium]|nr:hypothetical protein [Lujinxingiaceae bacterium]
MTGRSATTRTSEKKEPEQLDTKDPYQRRLSNFKVGLAAYGEKWERRTLYAAEQDVPLRVSMLINKERRAGLGGPSIIVAEAFESIDVADVERSWLSTFLSAGGHNYAFDVAEARADLKSLIGLGLAPADRGLEERLSVLRDGHVSS